MPVLSIAWQIRQRVHRGLNIMQQDPGIFVGKGEQSVYLLPQLANRHGLIAGATGCAPRFQKWVHCYWRACWA